MKKNFILGVIASLIASLIFEAFTSFHPLTLISSLVRYFLGLLTFKISISVWMLILVALAIPVVVVVVLIGLNSLEASKSVRTQSDNLRWTDYISDVIFEIRWMWGWYGQEIRRLTALCPKCLNELLPSIEDSRGVISYDTQSFLCDHCGFQKDFPISTFQVERKVQKEIRRRLRTGEFIQELEIEDMDQTP